MNCQVIRPSDTVITQESFKAYVLVKNTMKYGHLILVEQYKLHVHVCKYYIANIIGFKASGQSIVNRQTINHGQSNLVKAALNLWAKLTLASNTILLGSQRVSTGSRSLMHLSCLHSKATWSHMTDNNAGKFSLALWRCLHKHKCHKWFQDGMLPGFLLSAGYRLGPVCQTH